ncbi:unnamed protein product [Protopolystoma xenopodis]|uniref:Uncharacterized protein n=1 Tax=Protopolystoma xenopodis TaxID=117903 RepID=A0A3S5BUC1_9PLAT|nr:unnamed protein product [Protopolystoma xenopodis]
MVFVEEDPEIGSTIKQTLESGFPVKVRDIFTLDIVAHYPRRDRRLLNLVEVWQFRIDTEHGLETSQQPQASGATSSSRNSNNLVSDVTPGTVGDVVETDSEDFAVEDFAVDDFRKSRLFEKLGTMLKSIIVVSRLLPGISYFLMAFSCANLVHIIPFPIVI